jgi:hypothetical protein
LLSGNAGPNGANPETMNLLKIAGPAVAKSKVEAKKYKI